MNNGWEIDLSDIEGVGVFTTRYFEKYEPIDVGIEFHFDLIPSVTYFGGKINHSYTPNTILRYDKKNRTWNIYARYNLKPGTEITLDYRDTPSYIKKPDPSWN